MSSEIDFFDNLFIEEWYEMFFDIKCIFQVCFNDENVIRFGFYYIDDFIEIVVFSGYYLAVYQVFLVVVFFFKLRQL